MARFAISAEGAASMHALANQLLSEANAIFEASRILEKTVVAEDSGLGIYKEEIITLIQQGRNTLNAAKEDTIELAKQIQKKAQEIEELVALTSGAATGAVTPSVGAASGISGSKGGLAPTRTTPRALLASQFGFTKDDDGNSVYDSPMEMDKHLYAEQGKAYSNIQGTCGLCSCANVLRLAGVDVDEKRMVDYAMNHGVCSFDKDDPDSSGGTSPYYRQQILKGFGIDSHLEAVQTDNGVASDQTMNSIADNVSAGRGVIVSVDAGHFYKDVRYLGGGHALAVTSVKKSSSGEILGYYVCDSNHGTIFIKKDHLRHSLRASHINVTDSIIR